MPTIILFSDYNLKGTHLILKGDSYALEGDIRDGTRSIIVADGLWFLYSEDNHDGDAWVVASNGGPKRDGVYPTHTDYFGDGKIRSVQSITPKEGPSKIVLFKEENFSGESSTITIPTPTYQHTVESLIVAKGKWRIWTKTDYSGEHLDIVADDAEDGFYPTLKSQPTIGSVEPVTLA